MVRDFSGKRLARALQDQQHTRRKDILERIMRLKEEKDKPEFMDVSEEQMEMGGDTEIEIARKKWKVTGEQAHVLRLLEDKDCSHVVVQAPAGTGKTYTISLYVLKLLQENQGIIIITASTNLAVQEITENVLKEFDFDVGEVLFLQSITNELEPLPPEVRRWELCRVAEVLQAFYLEDIEEAKTAVLKRYISKGIVHDGNEREKERQ